MPAPLVPWCHAVPIHVHTLCAFPAHIKKNLSFSPDLDILPSMKEDLDLDLTNPETQLVIVTKPEDFFQSPELGVAMVGIEALEEGTERSLEWLCMVEQRPRKKISLLHPKELAQELMIEKMIIETKQMHLDARERLVTLKTKKARVQKLA